VRGPGQGRKRIRYLVTQDVDGEPCQRIRRQEEVRSKEEQGCILDILDAHLVLE
jgi:hypothetical protein